MFRVRKSAFTLIELLVVISIIGLLASIILASLAASRAKARDARRIADLHEIRNALELYFNTNSALPGLSGPGNCNGSNGCDSTEAQPWIPGLTPTFIQSLPTDPINTNAIRYRYRPSGNDYELDAHMENNYAAAQNDGGPAATNICPSSHPTQDECRYEKGTKLDILNRD